MPLSTSTLCHAAKRVAATATLLIAVATAHAAELNIYSARQEALIKPLLDQFSADTGVTVNLVTGKGDALLTRLRSEGRNSPADVLITTDVGRLYRAQEAGVLQAISSTTLNATIPAHLRSGQGFWYGLSVRARGLVYAPDRVKPEELSSYENLADVKWRGRICIRSSGNIYNQSLVASMLSTQGEEKTAVWLNGFVPNFARPPVGGDRDQIKAVAAGQCDVAIANSYYLGGMLASADAKEREAAAKVTMFWPNQQDRGTHINISGAGVTASAHNVADAIRLIEFLTNRASQQWYGATNDEYPVRADVPASELLQSWGNFKADQVNMAELGRLNAEAVMAMDRANWK
ncbi:MAG: iron(III) transport system substrate-binding protein [Halieaceae bacterium]|jgi:iron(III) transport system substrate-binding protein